MRTLAKIAAVTAAALALATGAAVAEEPVGSVPTPEKCHPIIGCIKR
jgi:hypothetical protein